MDLTIIRIERSQKAQRHIAIKDLSEYLDKRWTDAVKERNALCGRD